MGFDTTEWGGVKLQRRAEVGLSQTMAAPVECDVARRVAGFLGRFHTAEVRGDYVRTSIGTGIDGEVWSRVSLASSMRE